MTQTTRTSVLAFKTMSQNDSSDFTDFSDWWNVTLELYKRNFSSVITKELDDTLYCEFHDVYSSYSTVDMDRYFMDEMDTLPIRYDSMKMFVYMIRITTVELFRTCCHRFLDYISEVSKTMNKFKNQISSTKHSMIIRQGELRMFLDECGKMRFREERLWLPHGEIARFFVNHPGKIDRYVKYLEDFQSIHVRFHEGVFKVREKHGFFKNDTNFVQMREYLGKNTMVFDTFGQFNEQGKPMMTENFGRGHTRLRHGDNDDQVLQKMPLQTASAQNNAKCQTWHRISEGLTSLTDVKNDPVVMNIKVNPLEKEESHLEKVDVSVHRCSDVDVASSSKLIEHAVRRPDPQHQHIVVFEDMCCSGINITSVQEIPQGALEHIAVENVLLELAAQEHAAFRNVAMEHLAVEKALLENAAQDATHAMVEHAEHSVAEHAVTEHPVTEHEEQRCVTGVRTFTFTPCVIQ